MSRNNTGNPIGSKAFPDFEDNVKNLDEAVNDEQDTFQDRLGKSRLTWAGMESGFGAGQASREQRFRTFIASSGYQFAGEYAAGIEITQYNQILRDENGEFWRVSGQVDLPYVTTGAGVPEDDALVPAGDAVLRQDLANPDKGAAMVGYAGGTVEDALKLEAESAVSVLNRSVRHEKMYAKYDNASELLTVSLVSGFLAKGLERTCVQYNLKADVDGLFDMNSIVVGASAGPSSSSAIATLTGEWNIGSAPNNYATTVGDTAVMTGLYGDSISIRHTTDNRGGVFRATVYSETTKEIVAQKTFTTYRAAVDIDSTEIASGLPTDTYTVHLEFLGDDPLNPPSSGTGTSRGWLRADPSATAADTTAEANITGGTVIMRDSVVIFAIRGRPDGSTAATSWVPSHSGQTGVSDSVSVKVFSSERDLPNNMPSELPSTFTLTDSISISQRYVARNFSQPSPSMWIGNILHTLDKSGWSVDHKLTFSVDVEITGGYLAMLASDSSVFSNALIYGQEKNLPATLSSSAASVEGESGMNGIFYNGEYAAGRPIYYGITVSNLKNAINSGRTYAEPFDNSGLITDRTDGVAKLYWRAAAPGVIPGGEEWKCSFKVAAGISAFPASPDGLF